MSGRDRQTCGFSDRVCINRGLPGKSQPLVCRAAQNRGSACRLPLDSLPPCLVCSRSCESRHSVQLPARTGHHNGIGNRSRLQDARLAGRSCRHRRADRRSSDLNLLEVLLLRVQIDDSDVPMTKSEINFLTVYICNPILAGV